MKPQIIRLFDVFAIGPFMLYAAGKLKGNDKTLMQVIGWSTIFYNGVNYLKVQQIESRTIV